MIGRLFGVAGLLLAGPFLGGTPQAAPQATTAITTPAATQDRLVMLGTGGGPIPRVGRSQPAHLLQLGARAYLIDVGAGVERQLVQAGVEPKAIDAVFFTHLHHDHSAGLMGFIALDWTNRRMEPVVFRGPPGTRQLVADTIRALRTGETLYRLQIPGLPLIASVFSGEDLEVTGEREVYRDELVRVRAVENSHYSTMKLPMTDHGLDRSYSYRFELPGRSIVFTGDTGPSPAVEALAKGADLLVSELIDLDSLMVSLRGRQAATGIDQQPLIDHMAKEHLTPENVGRLAAAAGVGRVVLTHIGTAPGVEDIDREAILAGVRRHYAGPVSIAEDLEVY